VTGRALPLRRLDRPSSLSQQAYERIRKELLAGNLGGDSTRLIERELAERLSMSRTPIRDALRRLELAGIVEPLDGGGYRPRRVTLRDVEEHYELSILLEPLAAQMVAEREGEDIERFLDSEAVAERDATPWGNTRFHVAVAEASGNVVLARVISTLNERLAAHRIAAEADPETDEILAEEQNKVVDAIRRRDPEAAATAMRTYLEVARRLISQRVRTREAIHDEQ
jgi:DNA-binding GntR family transcriptional regulator